jgi:hypothetical protein
LSWFSRSHPRLRRRDPRHPVWAKCRCVLRGDHRLIERFIVTIEGPGWTDAEDIELPRLPDEGESLETKFGTMIVAHAEDAPDLAAYAGRIVCRFP